MRIFLISNMYPSDNDPLFGVFVKNFKKGLEHYSVKFQVISVIKGKSNNIYQKIKNYFTYSKSILSNYSENNYDLVYIHYLSINSFIFWFLSFKNNSKPIVVNVHGSDVMQEGLFMRFFNKYLLIRSNLIVVPSRYFKKEMLLRYEFLNDKKIFISPSGGVNPSIFYIKEKIKKDDTLILGYVSRIDKGKGWEIFLDLIKLLYDKGISINGIIVGDGLQKQKLLKKIKDLGINNVIEYRGLVQQNKLADLFNQFDLFIFPTLLNESLGLVGLEAMSCGVPVVASNFGGPSGYISDGYNGFQFDRGDVSELLKRVERYLLLSSASKDEMRNNAFNTSINYQYQKVMESLKQKLDELC